MFVCFYAPCVAWNPRPRRFTRVFPLGDPMLLQLNGKSKKKETQTSLTHLQTIASRDAGSQSMRKAIARPPPSPLPPLLFWKQWKEMNTSVRQEHLTRRVLHFVRPTNCVFLSCSCKSCLLLKNSLVLNVNTRWVEASSMRSKSGRPSDQPLEPECRKEWDKFGVFGWLCFFFMSLFFSEKHTYCTLGCTVEEPQLPHGRARADASGPKQLFNSLST